MISHIATVGNYEYGFFWYLYLDGNLQLEVKLTGIMSTQALAPGEVSPYATTVAPGLAAPVHQHLFCARLDLDVDGTANQVEEVDAVTEPAGPDNPWGNAFRAQVSVLRRESEAKRETRSAASRSWRITNPGVRNGLGQPVGYQLVPTMSTPTLLARPESSVGAARRLRPPQPVGHPVPTRRAAGRRRPPQPARRAAPACPPGPQADRDLVDTDVVVWYSFGVTHLPRPEDWPVMPVEYTGFLLSPYGFFDRNPALDVAPSPTGHCHHDH